MSSSPLRSVSTDERDAEERSSWDAFLVWRDRVLHPSRAKPRMGSATPGWDPYAIWLSRVKRGD